MSPTLEKSALIRITLPDGSTREVAPGTTVREVAESIGPGLAKAAIAGVVNGDLVDLDRAVEQDAALEIFVLFRSIALIW